MTTASVLLDEETERRLKRSGLSEAERKRLAIEALRAADSADGPDALDAARWFGRTDARRSWGRLVDEHAEPFRVACDEAWREVQVANGTTRLRKRAGRGPTARESAAYAIAWASVIRRSAEDAAEDAEPQAAVAEYHEPRTAAELAKALKLMLVETFDATPGSGSLAGGSDFEVAVGDAELVVAVVDTWVWYKALPAVKAAIRAKMK